MDLTTYAIAGIPLVYILLAAVGVWAGWTFLAWRDRQTKFSVLGGIITIALLLAAIFGVFYMFGVDLLALLRDAVGLSILG